MIPALAPDHRLARAHPKVMGQPITDARRGHAVAEDRGDSFGDDPIRVDGTRTQERWLQAEMMAARRAVMDADCDLQQDGVIKINVDGGARRIPNPRRELVAAITGRRGPGTVEVVDSPKRLSDRSARY